MPFRQPGEGAAATVADPVTNATHGPAGVVARRGRTDGARGLAFGL